MTSPSARTAGQIIVMIGSGHKVCGDFGTSQQEVCAFPSCIPLCSWNQSACDAQVRREFCSWNQSTAAQADSHHAQVMFARSKRVYAISRARLEKRGTSLDFLFSSTNQLLFADGVLPVSRGGGQKTNSPVDWRQPDLLRISTECSWVPQLNRRYSP